MPRAATDERLLRVLADEEIAAVRERLHPRDGELGNYELFVVGALETGLYCGPKPGCFSLNDRCPYDRVIEVDLRLLLGADKHPHRAAAAIAEAFESDGPPDLKVTYHWDRVDIPTAHCFRYEPIADDLGLEWELTVSRRPYVDIAHFWSTLFSAAERGWQQRCRAEVYQHGPAARAEYVPFKNLQNTEARWRLVSSCALASLIEHNRESAAVTPPISRLDEEPVAHLVRLWLQGKAGHRTLDCPEDVFPPGIEMAYRRRVSEGRATELPPRPPKPYWVTRAALAQGRLKRQNWGVG